MKTYIRKYKATYNDGLTKDQRYHRRHRKERNVYTEYDRRYFKKYWRGLTKKLIQLIYENNIKKYGTLTCYLCLKYINFGDDNLEHKIPISRGGINEYNNLAVAHKNCNCKKHSKTEKEYRNLIK